MAGLFGSRPRKSSFDQTTTGTSTTTNTRTPRQQNVFKEVLSQLLGEISKGPQVTQAERNQMRTGINTQYNALAPQMESGLTSRGFGESGKLGAGFKNLAFSRANDIQSGELSLKDKAQQRYASLLGLAYPFTRPDTYTTNTNEHYFGEGTKPGPSLFDQLLGYGGDIAGMALAWGWDPFGSRGGGGGGSAGYGFPGDPSICWVAQALYGDDDPRVHVLRHWLVNVWSRQSIVGAIFVALYRRFGERVAGMVKRHGRIRNLARFIFDALLRRAVQE